MLLTRRQAKTLMATPQLTKMHWLHQNDAAEAGRIMRVTPTQSKELAPEECLTCALLGPLPPSVSGGVPGIVVAFILSLWYFTI